MAMKHTGLFWHINLKFKTCEKIIGLASIFQLSFKTSSKHFWVNAQLSTSIPVAFAMSLRSLDWFSSCFCCSWFCFSSSSICFCCSSICFCCFCSKQVPSFLHLKTSLFSLITSPKKKNNDNENNSLDARPGNVDNCYRNFGHSWIY